MILSKGFGIVSEPESGWNPTQALTTNPPFEEVGVMAEQNLFECVSKVKPRPTHKMSGRSIHNIWMSMIQRCANPQAQRYADYGGRGVSVCARWLTFENFLSDMGERPAGKSLDRIDVNGNYEPGNCRWADRFEQANNARTNKRIEYGGKVLTEAQWAREVGIKRSTLQHRLNAGWSIAQALGMEERPESKRYLCASKR